MEVEKGKAQKKTIRIPLIVIKILIEMEDSIISQTIGLYCTLMNEVKNRTFAVIQILNGQTTTAYKATDIEFMCLQIRKILELISMGSLVMNKDLFEEIGQKYAQYWNAKYILSDIERLNPDFYPIPIIEVPSDKKKIVNNLQNKASGFLTRNKFVTVYDKCGMMMHASNPFGSKYDYEFYNKQITEWLDLIIELLNSHLIHIKGIDGFYLIHMQEDGKEGVHGYYFEKNNIK